MGGQITRTQVHHSHRPQESQYFETQPHLCSRQTRWWEYISCFNFAIQHVDGTTNWVVDCLSRYYEADKPDETHLDHEFVSVDTKLDPNAELLPIERYVEVPSAVARRLRRLTAHVEQ